jgi:predicted Fe-Mo cluster-binding NifX family protein
MIVAIPVSPDGQVGHAWGKAAVVAVAHASGGQVTSWTEHEVRWDLSHDAAGHGEHHARVVRFLREHEVTHVVADHMGEGMVRTLAQLHIQVSRPEQLDARAAVAALTQAG